MEKNLTGRTDFCYRCFRENDTFTTEDGEFSICKSCGKLTCHIDYHATAKLKCPDCGSVYNVRINFKSTEEMYQYSDAFHCTCGCEHHELIHIDTCQACGQDFEYFTGGDPNIHICDKCIHDLDREFQYFLNSYSEAQRDYLIDSFDIRNP